MSVSTALRRVLGDAPVAIRAFDGSHDDPPDAAATLDVRSSRALTHLARHPGELGFVRAHVAGDIEIEGDIYALLAPVFEGRLRLDPRVLLDLLAVVPSAPLRASRPAEEARLRGRVHTPRRDRDAITHHYDVSADFYRIVLGSSLTYSCALFATPATSLEAAQAAKHELVCTKLGLEPGMRLLDVGCGWGSTVIHAALHHGVEAVGVTVSASQAAVARRRVATAGLADRVEIRVCDYRDVVDGPFDAISSIGMFEHVGRRALGRYFHQLHQLAAPGARVLNHAISRPADVVGDTRRAQWRATRRRLATALGSDVASRIDSPFMRRYVFPDAELHEVGAVVTSMQEAGLEARHLENLREHYALTLRQWVANLEREWDRAVADVGPGRARVWRLYMAGSALAFERGELHVDQVLGVRLAAGRSGLPLRPAVGTTRASAVHAPPSVIDLRDDGSRPPHPAVRPSRARHER